MPKLSASPPDVEVLRVYLTLPLYHEFYNPKQHLRLQRPFAKAVLSLKTQANRVISAWWSSMNNEYFEKLVMIFKVVANYIIRGLQVAKEQVCLQKFVCFFYYLSFEQMSLLHKLLCKLFCIVVVLLVLHFSGGKGNVNSFRFSTNF